MTIEEQIEANNTQIANNEAKIERLEIVVNKLNTYYVERADIMNDLKLVHEDITLDETWKGSVLKQYDVSATNHESSDSVAADCTTEFAATVSTINKKITEIKKENRSLHLENFLLSLKDVFSN